MAVLHSKGYTLTTAKSAAHDDVLDVCVFNEHGIFIHRVFCGTDAKSTQDVFEEINTLFGTAF